MTAPKRHRATVAPKSQRSVSPRLSKTSSPSGGCTGGVVFELPDELLENPAAMLVILKLVEAGAGGSEQDDVAGLGGVSGGLDGAVQSAGAFDGDAAANLLLDLVRRSADQERQYGPLAQRLAQCGVVTALVFAAENDQDAAGKSIESFQSGVDIGGLGIVEETDAVELRDEFQAVLDALEGADSFSDIGGRDAREAGRRRGCQNVFEVVRAGQRNLFPAQNVLSSCGTVEDDGVACQASSLLHIFLAAEPENFGRLGSVPPGCGVIGVQHGKIAGLLVFENARFGRGIGVHGAVAVEMIGSVIQEHADVGTEGGDEFELKAAEFGDGPGALGGGFDAGNQGRADVAGEQSGETRAAQNVFDERGRGGLAVGAGDADEFAFEETEGELDFAPDGDALLTRGAEDGSIGGNTGAGNDEIFLRERAGGMSVEFKIDACAAQGSQRFAKFRFAAGVGGGHTGSARGAEERGGHAGAREADDQHAFPPQLE